jgi:NDP-sugar pyrophosphorylase family protein
MNKKVYGILPLAGKASRMMNIPKFLLPCEINKTLLSHAIDIYKNNGVNDIIAGVSEDNNYLLRNESLLNRNVLCTKTMAETVHKLVNIVDEKDNLNILIMPDTYFVLKDELQNMIKKLNIYDVVVILWKIKDYQIGKVGQCDVVNEEIIDIVDKDFNCEYEYLWGCIGWNSNMNKHINPNWETIGNIISESINLNIKVGAIISSGDYYDCGTFEEYFKMIKNNIK